MNDAFTRDTPGGDWVRRADRSVVWIIEKVHPNGTATIREKIPMYGAVRRTVFASQLGNDYRQV